MEHIRPARSSDACRLSEIEIFNYRLNFYPIFQSDDFYFNELQVTELMDQYRQNPDRIAHTFVYDDCSVKGFIRIEDQQIKKLFVEPVLQSRGIGAALLHYAFNHHDIRYLWALEKNTRAIDFYQRHGFRLTDDRKPEEGTSEFLIKLIR